MLLPVYHHLRLQSSYALCADCPSWFCQELALGKTMRAILPPLSARDHPGLLPQVGEAWHCSLAAEHLDSSWSTWFGGLTITHTSEGKTLLTGILADQAALYGIVTKIRDLGLTLLFLERKTAGSGQDGGPSRTDLDPEQWRG